MLTLTSAEALAAFAAWWLPFLRVAALFSSAPVLSHRSIPARYRIAAAAAIAFAASAVNPGTAPLQGSALFAASIEQVAVGLALGFSMQLVFAAVALAGELVGLQMGLGFGSFFDPQGAGQSPVLGAFFTVTAMLLLLSIDGHLVMIAAVVESFRDLPPGELAARLDPGALAGSAAAIFASGVRIAMPALAGLLLVNLAFGLIARVSPQLNVFAVGFPATLFAGAALLALTAPAWIAAVQSALATGLGALGR